MTSLNRSQQYINVRRAGDRILRLTVAFEHLAFEDALTILSYAAPYPVQLLLAKAASPGASDETGDTRGDIDEYTGEGGGVRVLQPRRESSVLAHPMYRSRSVDHLHAGRRAKQQQQQAGERRNSSSHVIDGGSDVTQQAKRQTAGDDATLQVRQWRAVQPAFAAQHLYQQQQWSSDVASFRRHSLASTASDVTDAAGGGPFTREVSITVHRAATPDNGIDPIITSHTANDRRSHDVRKISQLNAAKSESDDVETSQFDLETGLNGQYSPIPPPPHPFAASAAERPLTMAALGDYFINANPSLADEIMDLSNEMDSPNNFGSQTTTVYTNKDSRQQSSPSLAVATTIQDHSHGNDLHLHRNVSINSRHASEVNNNDVNIHNYPNDVIFAPAQNHHTHFTSAFSPVAVANNKLLTSASGQGQTIDDSQNKVLVKKKATVSAELHDFDFSKSNDGQHFHVQLSSSPVLPDEVSHV